MSGFLRHKHFVLALLVVLCASNALSVCADGKRFTTIAWGELAPPMMAVVKIGQFAEQVKSGSSVTLVAAIMALSSKCPQIDFSKTIGAVLVFDSDKASDPEYAQEHPFQFACVASPTSKGKDKLKTREFTSKLIDGKIVISNSEALLENFKAPPKLKVANSIILAKFKTAQLDKLYPGGLEALLHRDNNPSPVLSSLIPILKQCSEVELKLDIKAKQAMVTISAIPLPKSPLAAEVAKSKGDITQEKLEKIAQTISSDKKLTIKQLSRGLLNFMGGGHPNSKKAHEAIDNLFDTKASSNGSKIQIFLTTTPKAVKRLLDSDHH